MTEVRLPQSGMGMQEGDVLAWLKQVGDRVEEGEPLVEVETDKAQWELPSPASGVLAEIVAPEGTTVEVRGLLGRIE